MHNFSQYLMEGEEIVYVDKPVPGTGDKSIGGDLFIIGFMILMQALLIISVVFEIGDGADGININWIIIFTGTLFFDSIAFYDMFYKLFWKKRAVADDEYCLTNMRVFKYESKKDEITIGFLSNFKRIVSQNCRGGYGDVVFQKQFKAGEEPQDLKELYNFLKYQDKRNIDYMSFESIKSPRKVVKLAKQYRDKKE